MSIAGPGEVVEGQVASGYTVTLDKAPTTDVTVQLSYSGVAADGSDFTGVSSVVIKAGETSASFDIATLDDAYAEGSEAFTVTIDGVSGGGFDSLAVDASADQVTTTITDDYGPGSPHGPDQNDTALVSLSGPGEVVEGQVSSGYVVHLDKAPVTDVTVELVYGGTADDGRDFTGVASVTIPAGQTEVSFDLGTLADAELEGAEVIQIHLGEVTGGGFEGIAVNADAAQVETTIVDATAAPGGGRGVDERPGLGA